MGFHCIWLMTLDVNLPVIHCKVSQMNSRFSKIIQGKTESLRDCNNNSTSNKT